jgi:hypothetical protein
VRWVGDHAAVDRIDEEVHSFQSRKTDDHFVPEDHRVLQLLAVQHLDDEGLGEVDRLSPTIVVFGDSLADDPKAEALDDVGRQNAANRASVHEGIGLVGSNPFRGELSSAREPIIPGVGQLRWNPNFAHGYLWIGCSDPFIGTLTP